MGEPEGRFIPPHILITSETKTKGYCRERRAARRRRKAGPFASVGIGKERIPRDSADPSNILVPAALPPELEEALPPTPFAFSPLQTLKLRRERRNSQIGGKKKRAQELYRATRATFCNPVMQSKGNSPECTRTPVVSYSTSSVLSDGASTIFGGDSVYIYNPDIAAQAMKNSRHTSFGIGPRFQEERSSLRRNRVDRFYNIDTGPRCGIAKSVRSSLMGHSLAESRSKRFTIPKTLNKVGPGSYSQSYLLRSSRLQDRWDSPSPSFSSPGRVKHAKQPLLGRRKVRMSSHRSSPHLRGSPAGGVVLKAMPCRFR